MVRLVLKGLDLMVAGVCIQVECGLQISGQQQGVTLSNVWREANGYMYRESGNDDPERELRVAKRSQRESRIEREKKREMYHNNILWQKSATPWTRDQPWSHEPSPACESAEDVHVTAPVK